jgi:hypothetical protein
MALSKAGAAEIGDFYGTGMDCTFRPLSGLETPSTAGTETWVIVLLAVAWCTTLLLKSDCESSWQWCVNYPLLHKIYKLHETFG